MNTLRKFVVHCLDELHQNRVLDRIFEFCQKRGHHHDMVALRRALTDRALGARTLNLGRLDLLGLVTADIARICDLLQKSGLVTNTDAHTGADMDKSLARADAMTVAEHVEQFLTAHSVNIDLPVLRTFTGDADETMTWNKFWPVLSRLGVPENLRTPLFDHLRKQYLRSESDSQKIDAKWIRINGGVPHHPAPLPDPPFALDLHLAPPLPACPVAPQPPVAPRTNRRWRPSWSVRPRVPTWVKNIRPPQFRRLNMPKLRRPKLPRVVVAFPSLCANTARDWWKKPAVRTGLAIGLVLTVFAIAIGFVIQKTRPYLTSAATSVYHFVVNPYTLLLSMVLVGIVLLKALVDGVRKLIADRKLSAISKRQNPGPVVFLAVLVLAVAVGLLFWRDQYRFQYTRLLVLANMATQEDLSERALFNQQQETLNQATTLRDQAARDRQTAASDKATAQVQQTAAMTGNQEVAAKLTEATKLRTEEQKIRDESAAIQLQIEELRVNQQRQVRAADQQLSEAKTSLEDATKQLAAVQEQLKAQQASGNVALPPTIVVVKPKIKVVPKVTVPPTTARVPVATVASKPVQPKANVVKNKEVKNTRRMKVEIPLPPPPKVPR